MPRKPPTSRRSKAIEAFRNRHIDLFGVPSGNTTWDITVSKDPRKWRYTTQGYARADKPISDLSITACIAWHWAEVEEDPEQEPWAQGVTEKTIVLGGTPIPPPEPADTAYALACVFNWTHHYGRFERSTYVALGAHATLCPAWEDPAAKLIKHIRAKSIERLSSMPRQIPLHEWMEGQLGDPYVRK